MKAKKMNQINNNVYHVVYGAIIAALYVVLTLVFAPISFGAVQFRISEALCILPVFTFSAVPGIGIGCLIANFMAGAPMPDVIFGTLASLIGAFGTHALRNRRNLAWTAPVISNAVIIPFVLIYAYQLPDALWFLILTVGIGELFAVGLLGNALRMAVEKYENIIFKHNRRGNV